MTQNPQARGRRRFLLLVLLFAAPVVGAYAPYFWAPEDWRPHGRTNRGQLVNPARPVEALALHGVDGRSLAPVPIRDRWTLLLVGPSACDAACARLLYDTRQVRTALGKNIPRVRRLYVATDRMELEALQALQAREHPDLVLAVAEGAEVYALERQFSIDGRSPLRNAGDIYLLDPHGNWLMYYTPEDPPQDLLKDLKKLLRLSNIG
jgi:cytochrome oxidase Cu insertion factor (SCO1/SenC/PrrC family)